MRDSVGVATEAGHVNWEKTSSTPPGVCVSVCVCVCVCLTEKRVKEGGEREREGER